MNEKMAYKFVSEVKADQKSDGKMRFSGYLAYFDNVDSYGDIIVRGAFANTLKEAKRKKRTIPVLEQHGGFFVNVDNTPVGYYEELKEDDRGLYAEGILFNTSRAKDLYIVLKESPAGAMGQSIGYIPVKVRRPEEEETRRLGVYAYLEEVKLMEGSIVTFPANEKARVEDVKAASMFWRGMEDHFRKSGFSREDAKKAIALVKSCTPDALFAKFLAQYGNVLADEKSALQGSEDDVNQDDAAKKFIEVIKDIKRESDINSFKNAFKDFSLN